jgi:hypothetical protein
MLSLLEVQKKVKSSGCCEHSVVANELLIQASRIVSGKDAGETMSLFSFLFFGFSELKECKSWMAESKQLIEKAEREINLCKCKEKEMEKVTSLELDKKQKDRTISLQAKVVSERENYLSKRESQLSDAYETIGRLRETNFEHQIQLKKLQSEKRNLEERYLMEKISLEKERLERFFVSLGLKIKVMDEIVSCYKKIFMNFEVEDTRIMISELKDEIICKKVGIDAVQNIFRSSELIAEIESKLFLITKAENQEEEYSDFYYIESVEFQTTLNQ